MMKKEDIGSSFDDFLHEDGLYEAVTAAASKRVLARQIRQQVTDQGLPRPTTSPDSSIPK